MRENQKEGRFYDTVEKATRTAQRTDLDGVTPRKSRDARARSAMGEAAGGNCAVRLCHGIETRSASEASI